MEDQFNREEAIKRIKDRLDPKLFDHKGEYYELVHKINNASDEYLKNFM